jgi:hypothetical protein
MFMAVVRVENLTKEYRLATINNSTLRQVLQCCFARLRGQENPNSLISQLSTLNTQQILTHPSSLNPSTSLRASSQRSTSFCSSLILQLSTGLKSSFFVP